MAEKKRGRGRPAKAPGDLKSTNVTIRSRRNFRDQLERAATANGRSISEEAERRLEASLKDDMIGADLDDLHEVIRRYLRVLGKRKTVENFDIHDPAIAAGLRMGFDLIIDAIVAGQLSEERIKKFYMKDDDELRERGGTVAVNVAHDAFGALSAEGLGSVDPLKVSQWWAEKGRKP